MSKRPPKEHPRRIAPPNPAPYLALIASIPDELLTSERRVPTLLQEIQTRRHIRRLREQIFLARAAFEKRENVVIIPEPPLVP